MNSETYGIHWFRRDLRLSGNPALRSNWKTNEGRVLGLFCFDSSFLSREDFSHNRFAFFLETLASMREEFRQMGGDLLVVDKMPNNFFEELFAHIRAESLAMPATVSFNRDYEPFARKRDAEVASLLRSSGVDCVTAKDHLILEPEQVVKDEGFYQVYTPFSKKWLKTVTGYEWRASNSTTKRADTFKATWLSALPKFAEKNPDSLEKFRQKNNQKVTVKIPEAGHAVAQKKLQVFADQLGDYKSQRDIPSINGTSGLSIYFKNGSLTTAQVIHNLDLLNPKNLNDESALQYLKEIIWREFYYSILFHRPDVEVQSFLPQYRGLKWENSKSYFERWCEGMTGFPIVDAGMRQLLKTGWMHNRVRMIVASFLTKDLLIDWRWGENHFMKYLLDGDLAPNNGGWQWAASTGCDPQPYFRIFNPWLQSERFDPDGEYIKMWIPELRNCPPAGLHADDFDRSKFGYPKPMVEHGIQKQKAILLFKEARG